MRADKITYRQIGYTLTCILALRKQNIVLK